MSVRTEYHARQSQQRQSIPGERQPGATVARSLLSRLLRAIPHVRDGQRVVLRHPEHPHSERGRDYTGHVPGAERSQQASPESRRRRRCGREWLSPGWQDGADECDGGYQQNHARWLIREISTPEPGTGRPAS